MDDFDVIANLEAQAFDEGVVAGKESAKLSDIRDAGVMSGIVKGYELGLELGFMLSMQDVQDLDTRATEMLEQEEEGASRKRSDEPHDVPPEGDESVMDETVYAINSVQFNGRPKDAVKSIGSRIEKRKVMLAKRIAQVPEENEREFDFKGELESIRAMYRSCNSSAGPLVREGSDIQGKVTGNLETW